MQQRCASILARFSDARCYQSPKDPKPGQLDANEHGNDPNLNLHATWTERQDRPSSATPPRATRDPDSSKQIQDAKVIRDPDCREESSQSSNQARAALPPLRNLATSKSPQADAWPRLPQLRSAEATRRQWFKYPEKQNLPGLQHRRRCVFPLPKPQGSAREESDTAA